MTDGFKPIGEAALNVLYSLQERMEAQRGRHSWESPVRQDVNSTYRSCRKCGLTKITRHEPDNFPPHWLEYERDGAKITTDRTPRCEEARQATSEAAE